MEEPTDPLHAVLNELQRISAPSSARFRDLIAQPRPERLRFGQFWTTRRSSAVLHDADDDEPLRIVVTLADDSALTSSSDDVLTVVPISPAISYQSQDDLLIRAGEGPLGYDFMIEAWNTVAMPHGQLGCYLGVLPQPLKRYLGMLYQDQLGLSVELGELAGRRGPAILEQADPRMRFQEQEIAACTYLRQPALRISEAPMAAPAPVVAAARPRLVPEQQPFAGILAEGQARGLTLRDLAARLGLTPALVRKLDLRTFRAAPLEGGVVRAVADTFSWDPMALARYLRGNQTLASGASYRADQAPETTGQEDFFQAVREDPRLTEEQRAYWLRLAHRRLPEQEGSE